MSLALAADLSGPAGRWAREGAIGFGFWLGFLLVLEPGNLLGAWRNGHAIDLEREALRIGGAAALGALTAPFLFALCRRCPVNRKAWRRTAAVYAAALTALALGLLVVAHVLAAWALPGGNDASLGLQVTADLPLMVAAMGGFVVVLHGWRRRIAAPLDVTDMARRERIAVTTRGGLRWVAIADIDWIETQGNYVCLHVGGAQHLLRQTSTDFEASLDARCFLRIHRRAIVAVDRIASLKRLGSGDFELGLRDGTRLRGSRRYRQEVLARAHQSPYTAA